jgi:predicted metal-dependent phosphoesterase TrpH
MRPETRGRRFDLHVHTTAGSADASFRAAQQGEAARARAIEGVLISEHFRTWTDYEVQAASDEHGILIIPGREWFTPYGHVLSVGLTTQQGNFDSIEALREAADAAGAALIAAHPFRHFFDPRASARRPDWDLTEDPEVAARWRLFQFVDAIEATNGHCTDRENAFSARVADVLRLPATAGSDAHYHDELGSEHVLLPTSVRTAGDLAELIRSQRTLA